MLPDVSSLPVRRVSVVFDQFLPVFDLSAKKLLIEILERTSPQIEFVAIRCSIVEGHDAPRSWLTGWTHILSERRKEPECVRQEQRSIVPEIVADKPFRDRRLRRARLH